MLDELYTLASASHMQRQVTVLVGDACVGVIRQQTTHGVFPIALCRVEQRCTVGDVDTVDKRVSVDEELDADGVVAYTSHMQGSDAVVEQRSGAGACCLVANNVAVEERLQETLLLVRRRPTEKCREAIERHFVVRMSC